METTSIERLNQLHPKLRDVAIEAYKEAVRLTPTGIHPFITQTMRSFKESDELYQQGRTTAGQIVTNAPAGSSYHNYGLALDFVIQEDGHSRWDVNDNWMTVVNCFKKRGFEWGGNWKHLKDNPHLQMTFGYDWRDLLKKYNAKEFIDGTQYVII